MLRLLWEAFFLIGIWEMWRVESGSEPLGEHLIMVYRWLQFMWLQLEVVGGPVGVGSEPFEPQTGPQTGPKRPRPDGVKHRSALRRVRCLLSGGLDCS